ncbi:MAG: hypothetical protein HZC01_02875 [Candidatus Kerfeldbacteria bacterium]|nr:hypothetical protein [Candidatus Kerfeldbacteria bacterium]
MEIPWYNILKFVHVGSIVMGMGAAVFMHLQFVRKELTWGQLKHFFHFGNRIIWIGLMLAGVTGITLWIVADTSRPPVFYGKLALVAMVIIDGWIIHRIGRPLLAGLPDDQLMAKLPDAVRKTFMRSGVVSVLGWWGALAIAMIF